MQEENKQVGETKIVQTLFILGKNRHYQFDVNEDITIKKLKKILVAAAGLEKLGLRIFHDGVEYTEYDEYSLGHLFPGLQLIEFTLDISYDKVEDLDELVELKFKAHCPFHGDKYPYFYCFNCGRSICSECLKSGEHDRHDIKEKYDYLQKSRNLVQLLFSDLDKNIQGVSPEAINELKANVRLLFSSKLVEMVKKIEEKMIGLIDSFFEKEKDNIQIIQKNVKLLIDHCSDGLEQLKKEIGIEDMLIDEEVFLTFHSKFKEIENEKDRYRQDIQKFQEFSDTLYLIKDVIDKTYKEIYNFLLKYLKGNEFDDVGLKINSSGISLIERKKIIDSILSGIKNKPKGTYSRGEWTSILRNPERRHFGQSINTKPFILGETFVNPNNNIGPFNDNKFSNFNSSNNKNTQLDKSSQDIDEDISTTPIYRMICNVIPTKSEVILYNTDLDVIQRKTIEFPHLSGITYFLPESAWVNCNNKLYILGGIDNGNTSQIFLEYDPIKNVIKRLPNSKYGHASHSLFAYDNYIYAIGGEQLECEKFDFRTNIWTTLPNLSFLQYYPVLYIYNNMLYSFFGIDENGALTDKIQRLNLNNERAKWGNLAYKRNDCNLNLYGCGIIKISDTSIYLLGGKDENGIRQDAIQFDFKSLSATKTEFMLEDKAYFKDSKLHKLPRKTYGNFSIDENNNFLKIVFRVMVRKMKV